MDTAANRDTTDELARNSKQTKKQNLKQRLWLKHQNQRRKFNAAALVARKTTTLRRTAHTSLPRREFRLVQRDWNVGAFLGGCGMESVSDALAQSFASTLKTKNKKQHKENEE